MYVYVSYPLGIFSVKYTLSQLSILGFLILFRNFSISNSLGKSGNTPLMLLEGLARLASISRITQSSICQNSSNGFVDILDVSIAKITGYIPSISPKISFKVLSLLSLYRSLAGRIYSKSTVNGNINYLRPSTILNSSDISQLNTIRVLSKISPFQHSRIVWKSRQSIKI